jgi:hypothetical protein
MEAYFNSNPSDLIVHAIANCGFYEGKQNKNALDMLKSWCEKSKIN